MAMRWNPAGDLLGCMVKKNKMAVFDPRMEDSICMAASHQGPRAQKIAWIDNETFVTAGFNTSAQREFAVWDLKNLDQPMAKGDMGEGTGISHITYDREHDLLFNAGRGDSSIKFWQFDRSAPRMMTPLDSYMGGSATKAFSWLPKWCLDVNKHEIRRGARVTQDKTLEIVAFRLPSKSGLFQPDLYPPFPGNKPGNTFEEWTAGTDKPAETIELRPETKKKAAGGANKLASLMGRKSNASMEPAQEEVKKSPE